MLEEFVPENICRCNHSHKNSTFKADLFLKLLLSSKLSKGSQKQPLTSVLFKRQEYSLRKKWSFSLRLSSVNVTKSVVSYGFGHIYLKNPSRKISFFVQSFETLSNPEFFAKTM